MGYAAGVRAADERRVPIELDHEAPHTVDVVPTPPWSTASWKCHVPRPRATAPSASSPRSHPRTNGCRRRGRARSDLRVEGRAVSRRRRGEPAHRAGSAGARRAAPRRGRRPCRPRRAGGDVVGPQVSAAAERRGQEEGAAALEPADLDHGPTTLDVPGQPVEQAASSSSCEMMPWLSWLCEEEGESSEPADVRRPPSRGRTKLPWVTDGRGEQCRPARPGPAHAAHERLDPFPHGE